MKTNMRSAAAVLFIFAVSLAFLPDLPAQIFGIPELEDGEPRHAVEEISGGSFFRRDYNRYWGMIRLTGR